MNSLLNERPVVEGIAFRSAAPYGLDDAGTAEVLARLGVTTVVDLRSAQEQAMVPWRGLQGAGVRLLSASVDAGATGNVPQPTTATELGELYLAWLDLYRETFAASVRPLAQGTPTLLHCAAGKDRTGIASALVHLMAGHSREDIVEDYALTAQAMPQITAALIELFKDRLPAEAMERLQAQNAPIILSAPAQAMDTMLTGLQEQYGGVHGYLLAAGLSRAELHGLETHLRG